MSTKLSVLWLATLVVALAVSAAGAASYNPDTTIICYVHGFDNDGWDRVGVYGDDMYDSDMEHFAAHLGQPGWWTNPTAPNQIAAVEYYGDTPPAWYTTQDVADDAAMPSGMPRYALRVAKYIQHVLNRAPGATAVNVVGASMGTEVTRYMIEHDLCGLASNQLITRWCQVVGVTCGNWAASNIPGWLAALFGGDSPDIDQMTYDWVDTNISARTTMNTALYGPMVISSWIATNDADDYLTALTNKPNDGTNLCEDCFFWGYTTSAALHQATDGTLQMPGMSFQDTIHTGIADSEGAHAGWCAFAKNNCRVTIKVSRLKALTTGDSWIQGKGEFVFNASITSPRANTLWGIADPMQYLITEGGMAPGVYRYKKYETKYPNCVMFDQIVPPGETQLNVTFWVDELDWHPEFYNVWENPFGSDKNLGTTYATVSTTSDSVVYISCGNYNADLTTTVKYVY
ncbi:MAG: hypothetical protein JSV65_12230 [Armatimonadota bacterium]|nr:MAG: hypothetical protein JSV65_12230 [Armatimonadota bacterium]